MKLKKTKYIFENNDVPKPIKTLYGGIKHNIFNISPKLLEAIKVAWKCGDLCKKLKNGTTENIFYNTISCVKPILLENAIIYENGDIYSNNILYRTTYHENDKYAYDKYVSGNDILKKNVICLSGKWSGEIFHFPFEFLCGLRLIDTCDKYVHVKKNKYTIEWLELCGINNIICGNYNVENLYVPHFPFCGTPNLDDILWLEDVVNKNITKNNISNNMILVKRNKRRCIKNYSELEKYAINYAKNNNLNLIIHDDNDLLSLKTQLQYFSEAKIVITPHGGSEINLLACNKESTIIEMMDIKYTNLCFARIAYFLDLNYHAIDTRNFTVNISDIDKILNK